jgi:sugar phosphate isomerase/epimerase
MMNRRTFASKSLQTAAFVALNASFAGFVAGKNSVRLGAPLFEPVNDPDTWISALQKYGYRAAYCPLKTDAAPDVIKAYEAAARKAYIVIAEVGAWSNPLSNDTATATSAFKRCVDSLALAEAIGANCCVNIAGSKNTTQWAGPHKDNLTQTTFDQIVDITRRIIDEVKPTRTFFTLEFMPWVFPDSADSYVKILKAVNRKQCAVHLDPVNIVIDPRSFYANGALIKECFKKLGPQIRSCHGKDIILKEDVYTPQLVECRPGLGQLDYRMYLTELSRLKDIPLMLEHLPNTAEYEKAATYIRSVGNGIGIDI